MAAKKRADYMHEWRRRSLDGVVTDVKQRVVAVFAASDFSRLACIVQSKNELANSAPE
jgi:hypothetical protein